tara:strand:+ start:221 stop:616 length:396 start_codon:yes stop_codon:yes gene_type:complete
MRFVFLTTLAILLVVGCAPVEQVEVTEPVTTPTDTQEMASTVKEFDMIARNWDFEPSTITVNEGDTVLLHIQSVDVAHGFGLSAFGINEYLAPGETVDVEFVADQKGTFQYVCSVYCGSGHGGMNGQLIVE